MECVDIAGVPVGRLTRAEWRDYLQGCVEADSAHHHVSMNAAKWVAMSQDPTIARAVGRATSIGADGVGIVAASWMMGTPLPERVPGCELAADVVRAAASKRWRVALFGAQPDVLATVTERLRARRVNVVFGAHGYHGAGGDEAIAERIGQANADVLLVALGSPRAETFIDAYSDQLGVGLAMGVGGTFDVWSGRARRAPRPVQRVGLEWAWRWAGAPRARFGRAVLDSARFVRRISAGRRVAP